MTDAGNISTIVDESTITISISPGAPIASRSTIVIPLDAQMDSSSQSAPLLPSTQDKTGSGCLTDFIDVDKLNARVLKSAFESMLRQVEM